MDSLILTEEAVTPSSNLVQVINFPYISNGRREEFKTEVIDGNYLQFKKLVSILGFDYGSQNKRLKDIENLNPKLLKVKSIGKGHEATFLKITETQTWLDTLAPRKHQLEVVTHFQNHFVEAVKAQIKFKSDVEEEAPKIITDRELVVVKKKRPIDHLRDDLISVGITDAETLDFYLVKEAWGSFWLCNIEGERISLVNNNSYTKGHLQFAKRCGLYLEPQVYLMNPSVYPYYDENYTEKVLRTQQLPDGSYKTYLETVGRNREPWFKLKFKNCLEEMQEAESKAREKRRDRDIRLALATGKLDEYLDEPEIEVPFSVGDRFTVYEMRKFVKENPHESTFWAAHKIPTPQCWR